MDILSLGNPNSPSELRTGAIHAAPNITTKSLMLKHRAKQDTGLITFEIRRRPAGINVAIFGGSANSPGQYEVHWGFLDSLSRIEIGYGTPCLKKDHSLCNIIDCIM